MTETLAVGEAAQCPVEISHLKVDAPSRWGDSAKALALIDGARAKGQKVNADVYLYDAASSTLGIRSVVGPRRRSGQDQRAARRRADRLRIKEEMKKLIRERGLENYSFARIALPCRSRAQWPDDPGGRTPMARLERPGGTARNDAADASRRRRIDGLSVHVRR